MTYFVTNFKKSLKLMKSKKDSLTFSNEKKLDLFHFCKRRLSKTCSVLFKIAFISIVAGKRYESQLHNFNSDLKIELENLLMKNTVYNIHHLILYEKQ